MAKTDNRIAILLAIIALIGTIGAAIITNWEGLFPRSLPNVEDTTTQAVEPQLAPHAPEIELNQSITRWGEQLMQFYLEPGESFVIKGMELYADFDTYPDPSCAGRVFLAYTWRVRQPYPQGGDLEIRRVLMGGKTEQVGVGSVGRVNMGYCEEHTFKNNGLEKIYVEVRYVTAGDFSQ